MPNFTAEYDQIEITDMNGDTWEVAFTREVDYSTELWGVDADGNRGERRTFIDEDNHVDTQVNYNGAWTDIEKLPAEKQHLINAAIEAWKQENEPMIPSA